jgi:hypothetical protein
MHIFYLPAALVAPRFHRKRDFRKPDSLRLLPALFFLAALRELPLLIG